MNESLHSLTQELEDLKQQHDVTVKKITRELFQTSNQMKEAQARVKNLQEELRTRSEQMK